MYLVRIRGPPVTQDDIDAAQQWLRERNQAHNILRAIHETLTTREGEWDLHHEQGEKLREVSELLKRWNSDFKPVPEKLRHTSCENVDPVTARSLREFINTIPESELDLPVYMFDNNRDILLKVDSAHQVQFEEDKWVAEVGEGPIVLM